MRRYTLSVDESTDPQIVAWLDAQANTSASVRQLIQAHLNGGAPGEAAAAVDLPALRAVFEAVLDERLNGISLTASPAAPDDEADQLSDFDDLLG